MKGFEFALNLLTKTHQFPLGRVHFRLKTLPSAARGLQLPYALPSRLRVAEGLLHRRAPGQLRLALVEVLLEPLPLHLEPVEATLQRVGSLPEGRFLLLDLFLDASVQVALLVEGVPLLLQRLVALVRLLDLLTLVEQFVGFGDPVFEVGLLLAVLLQSGVEVGDRLAKGLGLAGLRLEVGPLLGERLLLLPKISEPLLLLLDHRLRLVPLLGPRVHVRKGLLQPLHLGFHPLLALLGRPPAVAGPVLQRLIPAEVEDADEDLLPLARALLGELVGAALKQESRVDERVVVDAQGVLNPGLRLALGGPGEGAIGVVLRIVELKLEVRGGGLARFRARKAARDPVAGIVEVEGEGHLHVPAPDADELVVGLALAAGLAGFPPHGPRHRVQQGRLSLAVPA